MAKKAFDVVSQESGEKQELYLSQSKVSFDRGYAVMFLANIDLISRNRKLGAVDLRVLFYLMAQSDYENRLWHLTQKSVAEALDLTKQQVSKSVKNLLDELIVEKDEKGLLSLSPDYFWRGKAGVYKRRIKEREAAALEASDKADAAELAPPRPCTTDCFVCNKETKGACV